MWRTKHVTISSFPLQMPAKSIVTRLKHVTNAHRATRKCKISLSHKPGTVETIGFPARCRAGPVKNATLMEDASLTNATVSLSQRDRRADCSWARLVNPEVKASDVFLFGLHPKMRPKTNLVGPEAYKLDVKASHMLLCGLHTQPKPRDPFFELRVKASDVFLCGPHPRNEAKRPFWWAPRLTNRK